ncbi:MAG: acyl transferase [Bacteroidia bacterium]
MHILHQLEQEIFSTTTPHSFEALAMRVFEYQSQHNRMYAQYLAYLNIDVKSIANISQIPFLPVELFKTHRILVDDCTPQITFSSSSTTGTGQSLHYVPNLTVYENSFNKAFNLFYGDVKNYVVLALLPSYQEREGSSLIYMVDSLINESQNKTSGYFLNENQKLHTTLLQLIATNTPTLLIGVSYALLDFIEEYQLHNATNLIVMETGGMKGKRKELTKEELHAQLKTGFGVAHIHSEYSMTELLSQAYSQGDGVYSCPPWMRVLIRDTNDYKQLLPHNKSGGVNIIDLANLYSCAFIATQDLGKLHTDTTFEILGRFDNSDIRGCNLLVQ